MDETTHECPPEGSGTMPCCGQTPFQVPRSDRMTTDRQLVTCSRRTDLLVEAVRDGRRTMAEFVAAMTDPPPDPNDPRRTM